MGRCLTITFLLSGVLLAGLVYLLYDPLPVEQDNAWGFMLSRAKLKLLFIKGELSYRLGFADRFESLRAVFVDYFQAPLTEGDKRNLEIYDTTLNGVPVRVYKPKSAKGLLPGLVFYHGGGWTVLDVPSYDGQCAYFARTLNIVVISVEYRLAPEFPFPAGFDDCYKATVQVLQKGKDLGVDTSRVAIGGDSAGGNLAAAVSTKLKNDKVKPSLKAQLLIYGVYHFCELDLPGWKQHEKRTFFMYATFLGVYFNFTKSQTNLLVNKTFLTPEHEAKCFRNVDYKLLPKDMIPDGHQRSSHLATEITEDVKVVNSVLSDLRFAPLLADDVSNLPPTFVLAAGWDRLRDENIIYAERIRKTGTPVELLYLADSFHGIFNNFQEEKGYANGPKIMKTIESFLKKYLM